MQAVFLTKRGPGSARGIIVFALGWASSDQMVRHLAVPQGMDFAVLFDYRDMTLPEGFTAAILPYGLRYLAGWSFGVRAAGQIFGDAKNLTWTNAVAVNGTPVAIDDNFGIPERGFALTVRGIERAGTKKFLERMCGDEEKLKFYWRHRSLRGAEEIAQELRQLASAACGSAEAAPPLWDRAVVGMKDAIFPPENMLRYWDQAGVAAQRVEDMPHYPLYDPTFLVKQFGLDPCGAESKPRQRKTDETR